MRLHPNLVVILNRRITKNPRIKPEPIDSTGKPGITVVLFIILEPICFGLNASPVNAVTTPIRGEISKRG